MSYSHHLQGLKHALFDFFFVKFIITGSKGYIIVNSCHKQLIVWVLKNHTQPLTYHGKRFFGNLNVCNTHFTLAWNCLLYTSDAADEEDSVDLGGRRIIKKKKT